MLVLHNNDLNQVTWEMRAMAGDPKFEASQDLPDLDYARLADLCGLEGIRVENVGEIGPAWDRSLGADHPTLIDAVVNRDIPPIPPHVQWKQAKAVIRALMTGDPDAAAVVRQAAKQELPGWLPGRG